MEQDYIALQDSAVFEQIVFSHPTQLLDVPGSTEAASGVGSVDAGQSGRGSRAGGEFKRRRPNPPPRDLNLVETLTPDQVKEVVGANDRAVADARDRRAAARQGASKAGWPTDDPNLSEKQECTVVIEGIPWHIDEKDLTIQLLTAFGAQGWDVGNGRVIARNWMRELNRDHAQSGNRWRFTGRGYVRFKTAGDASEYISLVNGKHFANPRGRRPRQLTVRMAKRDQVFKRNTRPSGPQYYEDVWVVAGGNMEYR